MNFVRDVLRKNKDTLRGILAVCMIVEFSIVKYNVLKKRVASMRSEKLLPLGEKQKRLTSMRQHKRLTSTR